VTTFAPGVTFGELAVLEERRRTTRACCDHDVIVWTLSSAALERIARESPPLAASVYRALSRNLSARLRATTRELRDLADP
jgi:CRP-like cAMP-binding protein